MDGLYLDTTMICNSDHTTSPQFSFSWNLQEEAVLITILDFMELGIQHTTMMCVCVCVCVCVCARARARVLGGRIPSLAQGREESQEELGLNCEQHNVKWRLRNINRGHACWEEIFSVLLHHLGPR